MSSPPSLSPPPLPQSQPSTTPTPREESLSLSYYSSRRLGIAGRYVLRRRRRQRRWRRPLTEAKMRGTKKENKFVGKMNFFAACSLARSSV